MNEGPPAPFAAASFPSEPQARQGVRPLRWPAVLTLLAGLLLSATLSVIVRQVETEHHQSEFVGWAQLPRATLEHDLSDRLVVLQFVGSFFACSREVEAEEFRQFT